MKHKKYITVGTVQNYNIKIPETEKLIPLTHIYMTTYFAGWGYGV